MMTVTVDFFARAAVCKRCVQFLEDRAAASASTNGAEAEADVWLARKLRAEGEAWQFAASNVVSSASTGGPAMLDDALRDLLRSEPNPVEKLASEQQQLKTDSGWFADVKWRSELFLKTGKRIVPLECGHYVLSRALHRAPCPRCGEMIRSGYDHDGFRRHGMPDRFHWPEDPLLELNEGGRGDGHSTIHKPSEA